MEGICLKVKNEWLCVSFKSSKLITGFNIFFNCLDYISCHFFVGVGGPLFKNIFLGTFLFLLTLGGSTNYGVDCLRVPPPNKEGESPNNPNIPCLWGGWVEKNIIFNFYMP